jgi:hypothetical protein
VNGRTLFSTAFRKRTPQVRQRDWLFNMSRWLVVFAAATAIFKLADGPLRPGLVPAMALTSADG